eukprot:TRINITY_DN85316_c0_g1_i1.p2 TRINITY_DN85316_c0_g1~~TRINITY_DN85316_c0_g1_i1.p2  ORF type:complete len:111 (-),score=10.96 TRINITY_DN85316_c0_g1_i1:173-505(-)
MDLILDDHPKITQKSGRSYTPNHLPSVSDVDVFCLGHLYTKHFTNKSFQYGRLSIGSQNNHLNHPTMGSTGRECCIRNQETNHVLMHGDLSFFMNCCFHKDPIKTIHEHN